MASYKIEWRRATKKDLRRIDSGTVKRIISAVVDLAVNPYPPGTQGAALGWYVAPLQGANRLDGAGTQGAALGWYVAALQGANRLDGAGTQGAALGWYVAALKGANRLDGAGTQGAALGWYVAALKDRASCPPQPCKRRSKGSKDRASATPTGQSPSCK